ncbi:MAG: peptidylprolyl isomerase [Prolixibacteraceae bacterium]|jgi:peptidyl-prolyl cis-trans isomerase SurA|nr:peptidylprolyl isomerase [Prolixibacteraceae bacterium]
MIKSVSLLSLLLLFVCSSFAQKNIIVTIGDKKITKDEYEQVYRKNNTQLSNESDIKTPVEYLDLFIDYKLKVIEAEHLCYDTITAFKDELAGYRKELAKPYLTDITVTDSMVRQAYYRRINEVRASHIIKRLAKDASPADTVKAYNKLIEVRNQFINGEKSFEDLAIEYSDDPSVKRNNGDLGFFKVFNMLTEFENVAYTTPIGEVSMPFRTEHGYHILYVTDTYKNEGEMKVAHIMKTFKNRNSVSPLEEITFKKELDSLYTLLENGADFGELARNNSDDKATAKRNGEIRWITKTFALTEFAEKAFNLKENGDYSIPVRSDFGWHIVQRLDYRPNKSFEEMKDDFTRRVKRDPVRSKHSKNAFVTKMKKEYGYIAYEENIESFKNYFKSLENDTLSLNIPKNILDLNLYKIGDSIFNGHSYLALQIEKKNNPDVSFLKKLFIGNFFDMYKDEVVTLYENTKLEEKYPEFKQVTIEYHDGMLLFSIMEDKIWNKAIQDTIGLKNYYEANKDQYFWDKYFEGAIVRCYKEEAYDAAKKLIESGVENFKELEKLVEEQTELKIRTKEGKWEIGNNDRIDYYVFGAEKPEGYNPDFEFVQGTVYESGIPKTFEEAKGHYISDYQKVLETEWIKSLREKYEIKVNKKLLKKVKGI